jgi:hypothetical protein
MSHFLLKCLVYHRASVTLKFSASVCVYGRTTVCMCVGVCARTLACLGLIYLQACIRTCRKHA